MYLEEVAILSLLHRFIVLMHVTDHTGEEGDIYIERDRYW